jgi:chromate reductase, NAD(P)H dehydrogenase (quinone)
MKIVAISGSLRRASYNTALARAAASSAPPDVEIEVKTLHGVPLYDGDVEANEGIPAAAQALRDAVRQADGLLLVTPEYNAGIPGVFKNAIDWMSRPASEIPDVFGMIPVGIIGATPGRGGTRLAQAAWLPVLGRLSAVPYTANSLYLDGAGKAFDGAGQLVDAKVRELLQRYVAGFVEFARSTRRRR